MIAIILLVIAIAGYSFIIYKDKNTTYHTASYDSIKIVDLHNSICTEAQKLHDKFNDTLQKLNRKIIMSQDSSAHFRLVQMVKSYDAIVNENNDYLERSLNCIEKHDFYGSEFLLEKVNNNFEDIRDLIEKIKHIEITKNNAYFDGFDTKTNENSISLFFEGCDGKDEITARYKALAKAFHPDNKAGNIELFKRLETEYRKLING